MTTKVSFIAVIQLPRTETNINLDHQLFYHFLGTVSILKLKLKKDSEQNEIWIFSDAGRLMRPLFIVKNQRLCISERRLEKFKKTSNPFKYLMEMGIIELLGVEEEEDAQIACGIDILRKSN